MKCLGDLLSNLMQQISANCEFKFIPKGFTPIISIHCVRAGISFADII